MTNHTGYDDILSGIELAVAAEATRARLLAGGQFRALEAGRLMVRHPMSQIPAETTTGLAGSPSSGPSQSRTGALDTTCIPDARAPGRGLGSVTFLDAGIPVFPVNTVWLGDNGDTPPEAYFLDKSLAKVAAIGLTRGESPLSVELTSLPTTPYETPVELQLFARDPEELGQFFDTLETDPEKVRAQVLPPLPVIDPLFNETEEPVTLPDAFSVLSPRQPETLHSGGKWGQVVFDPGTTTRLAPITTNDFFADYIPKDPPDGAVSGPEGLGSVKAARLLQIGACTNQQWFADLVNSPTIPLASLVEDSLPCNQASEFVLNNLTILPVIRRDGAQLFLNADAYGKLGVFGCHARISALYDLLLDENGALVARLATTPAVGAPHPLSRHSRGGPGGWDAIDDFGGLLCSDLNLGPLTGGITVAGMDSLFDEFVTTTLRYRLNQALRENLSLPPAPLRSTVDNKLGTRWHCDPRSGKDGSCETTSNPDLFPPPSGLVDTSLEWFQYSQLGFGLLSGSDTDPPCCGNARQDACNAIRLGFAKHVEGTSLSLADAEMLLATGPGCNATPGDDCRLTMLLRAINQVDGNGKLRYWACEATDSGGPLQQHSACGSLTPCRNDADCTITTSLNMSGGCRHPFSGDCARGDHPDNNNGCMPDPTQGYCVFTPPLRRFVLNPDSITAVFFDSWTDWTNAALAAWYATEGLSILVDGLNGSVMCNYKRDPPGYWFPRRHFVFELDGLSCSG